MEEKLSNSQQTFVSKIISHTTHEFKNHLAIINESAGLMGDFLGMEKNGDLANLERYNKIIASIKTRVDTASELVLKLNHFGHRMDLPMACFNLNELLQEELKLLERYAGHNQVEFAAEFSADIITIYNYPSICQYIFYLCFEYLISKFEGGSKLLIVTSPAEGKVKMDISLSGAVKEGSEGLFDEFMQECSYGLKKMHAELNSEQNDNNQEKLTLWLKALSTD